MVDARKRRAKSEWNGNDEMAIDHVEQSPFVDRNMRDRWVCVCVSSAEQTAEHMLHWIDIGIRCAVEATYNAYGCGNLSLVYHLRGSWQRLDAMFVCCDRAFRFISRVHRHKFCVSVPMPMLVCVCAVLLYGRRHDQTLDFNSLAVNKHWFLCRSSCCAAAFTNEYIRAISVTGDVGGNDHNWCRWWPMANESVQLLLHLRLRLSVTLANTSSMIVFRLRKHENTTYIYELNWWTHFEWKIQFEEKIHSISIDNIFFYFFFCD